MQQLFFHFKLILAVYTALWYNSCNGGDSSEDFVS